MTGVWKGLIVVSVFVLLAVVGAACSGPATTDETEGTLVESATGSLDAEADGDKKTGSGSDSGDPESGDMDPGHDDYLDSSDSAPGRDDDSVGAGDIDARDDDSRSVGKDGSQDSDLDGGEMTAVVEPDPDYQAALASARFRTAGWKTDFSRHTVPYSEILSGGVPRDGIPPLDDPSFVTQDEADDYVEDREPVVVFEANGEAKAYPLQILTWHEIVNDEVGGTPVSVTYCPLCNSAVAFDRRLDGVVYDFGTSGNLRNSDLIMWDRQTESWWQQLTGEAIVGELAGKVLTFLPAALVSYGDFKRANPEGLVLSRETGYPRDYGSNPYAGYDKPDSTPFLYDGALDDRLPPKERVVTVTVGDADVAFPYPVLAAEGAVNYELNGQALAVFHVSGHNIRLGWPLNQRVEGCRRNRSLRSVGWRRDPHLPRRGWQYRRRGDGLNLDDTGQGYRWTPSWRTAKPHRPWGPLLVRVGSFQAWHPGLQWRQRIAAIRS